MADPKVGQKDSQGRYWTGEGWKTLDQIMKAQQTLPGKEGEKAVLPGVGEIQYTGPKYGWQTKSTVQQKQSGKPKPEDTKPKPEATKPKPEATKPKPEATKPVPPIATPPGPRNDRRTAPPASPVRQTPPQASPVAQYMKAAAAARKSGDPAEMAKVRDMGLQIWASTPANKKLAAAAAERERTRGTSATTNPLMRDMKDRLPAPATTTPAAGSALAGNQVKPAFSGTALSSAKPTGASDMSGATVTNRTPVAYKPELMKDKGSGLNPPSNTIGDTKSEVLKKGLLKKGDPGWANNARYNVKEGYDAYDIVLDYLLSEGHVDTVDEANYVMLQMSAEHIQNIVEVSGELFRGIFNPNNSAASKVQKTSPFNRPVTPLPSIVSPFARPASRDDSGKLTPYGAGGGAAAEKEGKSRAEVMKQGAKNLENKKLKPVNQGPDFGR